MIPRNPRIAVALPMLFDRGMNPSLQAQVRRAICREFYRRGLITWDMKLALRRLLARR